jgi:DNA-3-methyladenine glycosylase
MPATKLPLEFYRQPDVVAIAQALVGKYLVTCLDGELTSGQIVETEAYCGATDKACHAHLKRTKRTEVMFHAGGVAYVYLCYGIHRLFNIVTNQAGLADAVLVRAVAPAEGLPTMLARRGLAQAARKLTAGPGALTQALGIGLAHYGADLTGLEIWLEDRGGPPPALIASPRVGVGYAGDDARLPWRFRAQGSPWCSPAK